MSLISVSELAAGFQGQAMQCVDVRSATEFSAGHIPGASNIPLNEVEARLEDIPKDRPLVLICKGGARARIAADILAPCRKDLRVLDGGTDAWVKSGLPIVVSRKTRWSLERQVRFAAGVIVVCGTMAAAGIGRGWLIIPGFVGLGLTFAGLTDFCPMGTLLTAMPWNRAKQCAEDSRTQQGCCT